MVCENWPLALGDPIPYAAAAQGPATQGGWSTAQVLLEPPGRRAPGAAAFASGTAPVPLPQCSLDLGSQQPSRLAAGTQPLALSLPGAPGLSCPAPPSRCFSPSEPAPKSAFTLILLTSCLQHPTTLHPLPGTGTCRGAEVLTGPATLPILLIQHGGVRSRGMGPHCSTGTGTEAALGAANPPPPHPPPKA